jgi:hypothetical protein
MSITNRVTVSAEQDLRLVGPDSETVHLKAGLHYSRQDPYAVRLSFGNDTSEPVEWTFSRELLAAALHAPQGIGDIRAWPEARNKILSIELRSPAGQARLEARIAQVSAFLARTYELVPSGQEPACLDLDAELTELLNQA